MVALHSEAADRERLFRSAARQFVEDECTPAQRRDWEREADLGPLWSRFAAAGWPGLLVPEELGGVGAALTDAGAMFEEFGRGLAPGLLLSTSVLAALTLSHADAGRGNDVARLIAAGSQTVAVAVTERDYTWQAEGITLAAVPDGDTFVLHGEKLFVPDAERADTILCAVRWIDGGVTLVLVSVGTPGLSVREMHGWTSPRLFAVGFDHVRVSAEVFIGAPGAGWNLIQPAIAKTTAILCAYIVGACEYVYELSMRYAHRRRQFGQTIARFQRVQDHLINIRNWTDNARVTTEQALATLDEGHEDAALTVSLAKATASQAFVDVCEAAHHLHAGIGSDKAYGLYLYTKCARTYYHYLGSPGQHTQRIATLLGL